MGPVDPEQKQNNMKRGPVDPEQNKNNNYGCDPGLNPVENLGCSQASAGTGVVPDLAYCQRLEVTLLWTALGNDNT